jgi:hypothetical protein
LFRCPGRSGKRRPRSHRAFLNLDCALICFKILSRPV